MLRRSLELGIAAASTSAFISAAAAALTSIQTISFSSIGPYGPEHLMFLMILTLAVMSALCLIAIIGKIIMTERELRNAEYIECYRIRVKGLVEASDDIFKNSKS